MMFARCLKTLLKLHFRYCQQVLSQQQTRLEQYTGHTLERKWRRVLSVTTWGMYKTEIERQMERHREFSLKRKYNRKLENNLPVCVNSHTHTHTHTRTRTHTHTHTHTQSWCHPPALIKLIVHGPGIETLPGDILETMIFGYLSMCLFNICLSAR